MDRKRVMIIDDEEGFLKLIKVNLEKAQKYEVMTLSTGVNLLTHVRSFNPDLIIVDILMPKIDGVQICQILNDDPKAKSIPIMALSALDTDKDKLMMYKLGVVDFLVKPIEKDELVAKIEKALQNR